MKGRKWHLLVDILGLILAVFVTPASVQDRDMVGPILREIRYTVPTIKNVIADSAYNGAQVAAATIETGIPVEIVARNKSSPPGFHVLPKRWIVERTHGWLGRERRLSKMYDRNSESTRAWIHIAAVRLMARRLGAAA